MAPKMVNSKGKRVPEDTDSDEEVAETRREVFFVVLNPGTVKKPFFRLINS